MKVISLKIIIICAFVGFYGCTSTTEPVEIPDPKSEALEFSLTIIQSIIEQDTIVFSNALSDTIYFMETWEEPIPVSELPVAEFFAELDFSQYSMEDFNTNYTPLISEYDEYKNQEWVSPLIYWHPNENDYLFSATLIENGNDFIWDDLLWFVVTNRTGEWKLRALSG